MTKKQYQKILKKNGFDFSDQIKFDDGDIEIMVGYIEKNGRGNCDNTKTEKLQKQISKILGLKSGFKTGYGSWILTNRKINDAKNQYAYEIY